MKKYIRNLEESVSSVLNESLVTDAAELLGIEQEEAEDRIKGLSFANYLELGNAIDMEDVETAREILGTVAPIEESVMDEGKLLNKPTPTLKALAKKHDMPLSDMGIQLNKGIKVELEHTGDRLVAKEIALDHLNELPDYYDRLKKMEKSPVKEADNPFASAPSQGSSVDALAKQNDQTSQSSTQGSEDTTLGRKDVEDLMVGDDIEVIDIDGDPTPVTVKTARGPGDTLVVQTDKGEEHIVKKQAVSGTPKLQELAAQFERAMLGEDWQDDAAADDAKIAKFAEKEWGPLGFKPHSNWPAKTTLIAFKDLRKEARDKFKREGWIKQEPENRLSWWKHPTLPYTSVIEFDRGRTAVSNMLPYGEELPVEEARNASNTEHAGAKKGKGGYYGRKKDAKSDSNKKRRQNDKKALDEEPNKKIFKKGDLVTDRKTGRQYDPHKEMDKLLKQPETNAIMKRLAKEDKALDEGDDFSFYVEPDGRGGATVMTSNGDIHDYYDDVTYARQEAERLNNEFGKVDEELNALRRRAGIKETASCGGTGAGAVAVGAVAAYGVGGSKPIKRQVSSNPSIYGKTTKKPKPKERTKESTDDGIGRGKKQ